MARTIEEIFNDRTCIKFSDQEVTTELLSKIYDLMKLGPTSANSCPLRIKFIQSPSEKERLYKCLMPGNIEMTKSAPIVALFAYDTKFYDLLPKLFPHSPQMKDFFSKSQEAAIDTAIRNSTLQAAYFMIIARAHGLACGPMSGFDATAANNNFFHDSDYKINFICNLGYPAGANKYTKLPRLEFSEACTIV